MCMGVPSGPREIPLPMMQRFERDLLNSGMYIPEDFDAVIEWLADGRFDTSELVTDLFAIEDAAAAFERAQQNDSIKVMLQFARNDFLNLCLALRHVSATLQQLKRTLR